jgi:hypothetical protein
MRDGLLFLHILGAAGWIGGGLHGWYTHTKIARNGSTTGRALEILTAAAGRYFGPVAALTLLSGIALVWTEDAWTWTDTFVLIGLGVFVFSGIFQPLASKTEKRLLAAVEDGSDVGPALRASHRVYAIDLAVVLVALWAMVAKLGAG